MNNRWRGAIRHAFLNATKTEKLAKVLPFVALAKKFAVRSYAMAA